MVSCEMWVVLRLWVVSYEVRCYGLRMSGTQLSEEMQ
jgi:hypothetical protein